MKRGGATPSLLAIAAKQVAPRGQIAPRSLSRSLLRNLLRNLLSSLLRSLLHVLRRDEAE